MVTNLVKGAFMNKTFLIITFFLVLAVAIIALVNQNDAQPAENVANPEINQAAVIPSDEDAEIVGFLFIQDFIASAPPETDEAAKVRAYNALSTEAKTGVSEDTLARDLADFVGVQDVPNQGVSIEDLVKPAVDRAQLIVGLNYTGNYAVKVINLVVEDGEWKVDRIDTLASYPPQD
jgi:hypothetical protein